MNTIANIIKTTIQNLNSQNIVITPSSYEKEFFRLLSQTNLTTFDFQEFKELVESLDENEKESIKNQNMQSFYEVAKLLNNRVTEKEVKQFLKHLSHFLSASLDLEFNQTITDTCVELSNSPASVINDPQTVRKLRKITDIRITKDKTLFRDKANDVKKLVHFLSSFFKKVINQNQVTLDEVTEIKEDLENLDLSKSSTSDFELLQSKLLSVTELFEKSILDNSVEMQQTQSQCDDLYNQIEELQYNLSKAEEEKSVDFLTGLLTRRAYSEEVEKIEKEFISFDSKYAIVFYDIDHFKEVNDNYGHEAGDFILATFASILKKLTRNEDIICRYGGEEFISLVHYGEKDEIKNYLKRVKNIILNNNFVYEKQRINITFSAGVTFRDEYNSYEEAIKRSDELLYDAKNNGRKRIVLDNEEVF